MANLRQMLKSRQLHRLADRIISAAEKSVRLQAGKRSAQATSRLGGRPNLPPAMKWPKWREEPLAFVAQLDLSSIPKIPGLPLPNIGTLLFFFEGGETARGYDPKHQGSTVVVYSPDPLANLPLRARPAELPDHQRFHGVELRPEEMETTIPSFDHPLFAELKATPEEREAYYDVQLEWNADSPATIHRIGGHPDSIQGDPKLIAQLVAHGLYCGDSSGYQKGKKLRLWPGAVDWQLLFQVDSDERAKMMWGDVGRLYFLIHKTALSKKQFDKTWVIFQCS
jgi:uncharacterized protein YwqG